MINAKRKASIRRTNGKYFDHQTGEIGVGTQCYFMRGLMPTAWTTPDTPPEYFREEMALPSVTHAAWKGTQATRPIYPPTGQAVLILRFLGYGAAAGHGSSVGTNGMLTHLSWPTSGKEAP